MSNNPIIKFHRLKELRTKKQLRQADVADFLYCQRNVYRRYECGEREIPVWVLIKLSEYYQVSVDYLLNITNEPTPYPPSKYKR